MFRKEMDNRVFIIYFAISVFCPLSLLFYGGHGSRFWIRGAAILYTAFSIYFIWLILRNMTRKKISDKIFRKSSIILSAILIIGLGVIFFRNSVYLYNNFERRTLKPELLNYILTQQRQGNKIVTNSFDTAYLADLYSNMPVYLTSYSLQPYSYKKQLKRIMINYSILGVSQKNFSNIFRSNPLYSDWLSKRPFSYKDIEQYKNYYHHAIVFTSLYKEYNPGLVRDGMYKDNIILEKMNLFIKNNYPQKNLLKFSKEKYDIILDKAAGNILKVNDINYYDYDKKIILDNGEIIILLDCQIKEKNL